MGKLPCGCIPDASGYGYCSKCVLELRKKIQRRLSEGQKEYDRMMDPKGSKALEDACKQEDEVCCSCHINPPCVYCTSKEGE